MCCSRTIRGGDTDFPLRPASEAEGVVVLLRGLEPEKDEALDLAEGDEYSVRWADGIVLVLHTADRTRCTPDKRCALVAVLPREPRDVYTESDVVMFGE